MVLPVSWCRKSNVGGEYPFAVMWYHSRVTDVSFSQLFLVSRTEFDRIARTLESFSPDFPRTPFLVTDGKHWLAVDPSGYDYPRYKSVLLPRAVTLLRLCIPKLVRGVDRCVVNLGNSSISPCSPACDLRGASREAAA